MNSKIAVKFRIEELCKERGIAINTLAKKSKMTASTIYSMLNEQSKNPGIISIESICKGLNISVKDFFNSEHFE